jgi:hypothetical protein
MQHTFEDVGTENIFYLGGRASKVGMLQEHDVLRKRLKSQCPSAFTI